MKLDRRAWYLVVAAAMLAVTLVVLQVGRTVEPLQLRQPLAKLNLSLGTWRSPGQDQVMDTPTLELLKPQDYLLRPYRDITGKLNAVFVAYFGVQVEGAMIHSPRNCLPGGGWQIVSRREVEVPGTHGNYRVNQLILAQNVERLSVLYWYQGRGRVEPNEYRDRVSLVLDGLFQHRTDGALVRLTTGLSGDPEQVLEGQIDLARALIPALDQLLPPTPSSRR